MYLNTSRKPTIQISESFWKYKAMKIKLALFSKNDPLSYCTMSLYICKYLSFAEAKLRVTFRQL